MRNKFLIITKNENGKNLVKQLFEGKEKWKKKILCLVHIAENF